MNSTARTHPPSPASVACAARLIKDVYPPSRLPKTHRGSYDLIRRWAAIIEEETCKK